MKQITLIERDESIAAGAAMSPLLPLPSDFVA